MDWTVTTYVAYLLVTVPLTVWVATTLSRNGRLFLVDVFPCDADLATAVNRLLVVGFYLVNLGFVSLALRLGGEVGDLRGLFEQLSVKLGVVTLLLGVLHMVNVYVFNAIRRRHRLEQRMSGPYAAALPPAPAYAPPFPAARR